MLTGFTALAGGGYAFAAARLEGLEGPPVQQCAGEQVTVDIAAGDEPTQGDDVILGTRGPDQVNGLGGADTICGLGGRDQLDGGLGPDTLLGGGGRDRLRGGGDDDALLGGKGRDRLAGGSGQDSCDGGPGADTERGCEVLP